MKGELPPDLDRLLADYQRLTQDEMAALRTRDFPALARIHALKPAVLRKIVELGEAEALSRHHAPLNERLLALTALERENSQVAAEALQRARGERDRFEASRQRLLGLGQAYRTGDPRGKRLSAEG